jgi:hypothetical protein
MSINGHTSQNHDIQAKTNAEMVRIFQWLDGANDIEVVDPFDQTTKGARERIVFYLANFDWTFKALKLFKNGLKFCITFGNFTEQFKTPKIT